MGNKSSSPILPFTISSQQKDKLKLLSMVVSHIMNTPDIYDIDNLARPGACGDYAVVLKEQIEKKFLPFVADISAGVVGVVYQNPTKLIKSESVRKEICSQIADTAIRIASIVLACLSSIQIASEIQTQVGGDLNSITSWLVKNDYIEERAAGSLLSQTAVPLISRNRIAETYFVKYTGGDAMMSIFNLTVTSPSGALDPMPAGSFKLQLLNPLTVPGTNESILPIRVLDNTGIPWMVGVLFANIYKPLSTEYEDGQDTFLVWNNLFRRSQVGSQQSQLNETFVQLQQYNLIFEQVKLKRNESLFTALTPWLSSVQYFRGFNPALLRPQPPSFPGYGAPGFSGYGAPGYGAPGFSGFPGYAPLPGSLPVPLPVPLPPVPLPPVPRPQYGPQYGQAPIQYAIPNPQATRSILTTIKGFKDMYAKKSCPVSVRAHTIMLLENPDRTIRTGICNDPYWTEPNLNRIFPFATLQFLCIKDWNTLGLQQLPQNTFAPEWDTFVKGLADIYGPFLSGSGTLDQMSFKMSSSGLPLCSTIPYPKEVTVRFQEVKGCIDTLQAEYTRHTEVIWKILMNLVEVIEDPETKTELVRLVPKATRTGTKAYIESMAVEARTEIVKHYLAVEKTYYTAAKMLKVL
jgi:hypothetical protein